MSIPSKNLKGLRCNLKTEMESGLKCVGMLILTVSLQTHRHARSLTFSNLQFNKALVTNNGRNNKLIIKYSIMPRSFYGYF